MNPARAFRPDDVPPVISPGVGISRLTAENAEDLRERIDKFAPLDVPAGVAAARFLREDAVRLEKVSRTYLFHSPERIEGFFSLCMGSVILTQREVRTELEVKAPFTVIPATILTWIARGRDSSISGRTLLETAFGVARESSRTIASAAFALDPADKVVAEVWKAAPYGFRASISEREPPRLWTPLDPDL